MRALPSSGTKTRELERSNRLRPIAHGRGPGRFAAIRARVGLPPEFNLTKSKGLGMRVVMALAKQLGGDVSQGTVPDGTQFALLIPLKPRNHN
jgi:two-component sensor histidine kinase